MINVAVVDVGTIPDAVVGSMRVEVNTGTQPARDKNVKIQTKRFFTSFSFECYAAQLQAVQLRVGAFLLYF